jgi:hypothetical protein
MTFEKSRMASLHPLAVALLLSAPKRLAVDHHAASGCVVALDQKLNPHGANLAGFLLPQIAQSVFC